MTDQHRATPEQWEVVEICREEGRIPWPTATALLELRARIEALEAAQQDKLDRLIALDAADPTPDPAMTELRAWRPFDIETTYGSEAAADAAQILHAPMVVQGTFEHGGETYRFKAKPERESAMTELRTPTTKARPGGLVGRVAEAMGPQTQAAQEAGELPYSTARSTIREVAAAAKDLRFTTAKALIDWLDREADRG
jgi:hypothetical protein